MRAGVALKMTDDEAMTDIHQPYAPLFQPKPIGDGIWIVDGPEIRMDYVLGISIPFPTRMVIVRLAGGGLWLHSPVAPDPALFGAVAALGDPAFLIAPNSIHYWYLPDWQARFPWALTHAVPGLAGTAKRRFRIDATLGDAPAPDWQGQIDQALVPGSLVTEAVFHHRASRTLILTDLIENFEPARINSPFWRAMMRLFGAADPDGKAPYDLRWTFRKHRAELRDRVTRMIGWQPEQVIMAHGRPYLENGTEELRRAFDWALR